MRRGVNCVAWCSPSDAGSKHSARPVATRRGVTSPPLHLFFSRRPPRDRVHLTTHLCFHAGSVRRLKMIAVRSPRRLLVGAVPIFFFATCGLRIWDLQSEGADPPESAQPALGQRRAGAPPAPTELQTKQWHFSLATRFPGSCRVLRFVVPSLHAPLHDSGSRKRGGGGWREPCPRAAWRQLHLAFRRKDIKHGRPPCSGSRRV